MTNTAEIIAGYASRRMRYAYSVGHTTLKGLNDGPAMFCSGPEFWKAAAGVFGVAAHPPDHFEPQNYPPVNIPTQPTQPIAERQGEQ